MATKMKRTPEALETVVSGSNTIRIINPNRGLEINVNIGPNDRVTTTVKKLLNDPTVRRDAERSFTSITRGLINSMLELNAARLTQPLSEDVSPEISVTYHQDQFLIAARTMMAMGFTQTRLDEFVRSQGRQFTQGQVHLGEMPPPVQEAVSVLKANIADVFETDLLPPARQLTRV